MVSERAPLSAVPCVVLQENGEPLTMGRSSASCTYQLSSNRLISRVHVKASFKPAIHPFDRDKIEILCSGWNGIKLHCQGKTYELTKGKTFTSDIRDADVMIDVQDSRVLVQWPRRERKASTPTLSENLWEDTSPLRNAQNGVPGSLQDSPLRGRERMVSPISPSPAVRALGPTAAAPLTPGRSLPSAVVVYEDAPSPSSPQEETSTDPISVSQLTQLGSNPRDESFLNSIASSFSKSDEISEHDEENDPIVMSFGPFGENILPRMASFRAGASPTPRPKHSHSHSAPNHTAAQKPKAFPTKELREGIKNHVANQLAFSRLSSTPLFTIINNLPSDIVRKGSVDDAAKEEIKVIIEEAQCMGKVNREGKDAAGKPLDPEYYYVAEFDTDEVRKQAVVNDLRKPGLRNCRKQHKVREPNPSFFMTNPF